MEANLEVEAYILSLYVRK